jgi:signal transduction histidine kinase
LLLAFELSRKKYSQTKFFLFAWCVFLISVLVFVLKDYGVLPTNVFTTRSVQIGSVIEALLLSFALADKINTYRKEMLDLQVRELAISQENEKLIREQNVVLEQRVKERTEELQESNKSLSLTLENLKDAQAQLVESEKMASLGQLTAGVAHEINNPINFVTSNVSPLRRDVGILWNIIDQMEAIALSPDIDLSEKEQRILALKNQHDVGYLNSEINFLLKGIQEGAERTAEIVKSLRIFSRIDEDILKEADLNEGLDSTLVILNSMTKERIEIVKRYEDIPLVESYAGKVNQVFMNVLSNAIYAVEKKFNGNPGGELVIETKLNEDKSKVKIIINDNGVGIPEEIKNRIFEPFFTTKEVGEGTGLGMSIAYKTIDRHNGKILVESKVGIGTSFTIILPIRQHIKN